jgi:hypothetical protein
MVIKSGDELPKKITILYLASSGKKKIYKRLKLVADQRLLLTA